MRLPVRCHAWNTVSRSGGREHGRSEDRVSQQKASALVTGRLAGPRGDRVSPEGRHAGGLCDSYPETDSCSHGRVLAEACTVVRSWATANRSLSPGREAELGPGGLARAVDRSRPRPLLEATSATTDQVALEALGLLQLAGYPKIPRAETASRLDTWERCLSSGQTRRSGRSTPEVTRRQHDQCAFSTLPKEHPIGSLRWPLGSSRYTPRVKLG